MAAGRNISVSEASRPKLPRHARLKFDETRQVWVILAPERVLAPDEIAVEVLQLCDGVRRVSDMIDLLAAKYAAPREAIATDVVAMLQEKQAVWIGILALLPLVLLLLTGLYMFVLPYATKWAARGASADRSEGNAPQDAR